MKTLVTVAATFVVAVPLTATAAQVIGCSGTAGGHWRWHWLRGTRRELARVWAAYEIAVRPGTNEITHGLARYLVDAGGFQRTGYLFPFLPNFVQLDLQKLAREVNVGAPRS